MGLIYQWGLNVVEFFQGFQNPGITSFFQLVTTVGDAEFYILFIPLVVWCVDYKFGVRLSIAFLLATYVNVGLKDLLQQPRPYDFRPELRLSDSDGYGIPSGHTQFATVFWGILAGWINKLWFWAAAVSLIFLVGLSRVYLGVHFPTDVLAGWLIGGIFVVLFFVIQSYFRARLGLMKLVPQIVLALLIPILLLLLHPVRDSITGMATLSGVTVGLVLANMYVPISSEGNLLQLFLRFVVGIAVLLIIFLGLRLIFPEEGSPLYSVFRFTRYWMVGLWVSFGAPLLFLRLRLATRVE